MALSLKAARIISIGQFGHLTHLNRNENLPFPGKSSCEASDMALLLSFPAESFDIAPVKAYLHLKKPGDRIAQVIKHKARNSEARFLGREKKK